ncbi:SGNH/GDSL hydrolase family protein [Haloferula sp. A504]|uniref:SGNH/GDSL hydrolase family protein n=1 Tax=Haloferula sp. A504 TaxID=3373601 RepID=UPI0031C6B5D0|nr:SGNH/GDSL hydrolase family protein [Verrucomicrobiaceae bacterium E54]
MHGALRSITALGCLLGAVGAEDTRWSFYAGGRMTDESVLFSEDVDPRSATLLFKPSKVHSVSAANGSQKYEQGVDYTVDLEQGVLRLTPDSRIPCPRLYGGEGPRYNRFRNRKGEGMLFGEGDLFHSLQIRVDYDHSGDEWDGKAFVPENQSDRLPGLHEKLERKQPLRLCLIGDSISVGYNASDFVKAEPGQPAFGELVAKELQAMTEVEFQNVSRAGATASWGLKQLDRVESPDLVMIAFGMNDGNRAGSTPAYEKNVRTMITALRKDQPELEIVLVANMLPNEEFRAHQTHFENRDALKRIAADLDHLAVADVMSVTAAMLERKKFADICGNHVNHPNDFIHRLYASVILRTLGAE